MDEKMIRLVERLFNFCNARPRDADAAFKIVDYALRTYGDEVKTRQWWHEKIDSHSDHTLDGMGLLWSDFIDIMGD